MSTSAPPVPQPPPPPTSTTSVPESGPGRPQSPKPVPIEKDKPTVSVKKVENASDMKNCAFIVFIGPTGTGKSNFIQTLAAETPGGSTVKDIAKKSLDSGTQKVAAYRMDHSFLHIWTEKPIILVDTPGLSDRRKSEMYVLSEIQKWMKKNDVKSVDRLLYMDRISDNRMPRSKAKSLDIFKALCGREAANRTVVVTTMWDLMWNPRLQKHAAHRFDLLKSKHWKDFLDKGSQITKFDNTFKAAWDSLKLLGPAFSLDVPATSLFAFEKEGKMKDTEMGQKAFNVLTERYENLDVSLQVVQADIQHSKSLQNPELDQLLNKQKNEITEDLKEVTNELQEYSPDYKKFRDTVHAELDRPGSPESWTTHGSGVKSGGGFKAKWEGWLAKLREFTGHKSSKQKTPVATPYSGNINLPSIHELTDPTPGAGPSGSSSTTEPFKRGLDGHG
ncbi:hypothetical protein CVT24_001356 [Panaeolus cyanescens]|uniref:AIG1-type G domain-containing protein n=1 Tax=Panaeolus cyanescens TaxID=181874 RepID=A0A409YFU5_9AGAR|nr:hypothetical protein CVT24_001356 [Panaeolus cyanescens]